MEGSDNTAPMIGITLGDPSGVGPEIAAVTIAALDDELRRKSAVDDDALGTDS